MPGRGTVQAGDEVLVTAGAERPEHLSQVGEWSVHSLYTEPESGPELRRLGSVHAGELVPDRYERGLAYPMPLGPCVLARGRVGDVVPVVEPRRAPGHATHVSRMAADGRLMLWRTEGQPEPIFWPATDISDQLPFCDWSPGRWAFRLVDMVALDEPVRGYPGIGRHRVLPVRGRAGWWTPDPGLVEACRA